MAPKTAPRQLFTSICSTCRCQRLNAFSLQRPSRPFSHSSRQAQDEPPPSKDAEAPPKPRPSLASNLLETMGPASSQSNSYASTNLFMDELKNLIRTDSAQTGAKSSSAADAARSPASLMAAALAREPHHLHIYATKHNTHITLTRPNRDALISLSAGNLGFRKAQRGSYDAAFQLASYVMRSMQERGLLRRGYHDSGTGAEAIDQLEIIFRGFGAGREAVTKALLGNEGRNIRDRVVQVSDGTRLKFGGTRSPNPRRLG